jgi:hypothetical protein
MAEIDLPINSISFATFNDKKDGIIFSFKINSVSLFIIIKKRKEDVNND